ncbi:unnamed protein product, partial [Amoebophrya sp. A25]
KNFGYGSRSSTRGNGHACASSSGSDAPKWQAEGGIGTDQGSEPKNHGWRWQTNNHDS